MIQFDDHTFQIGWFNHQLEIQRLDFKALKCVATPGHTDGCILADARMKHLKKQVTLHMVALVTYGHAKINPQD